MAADEPDRDDEAPPTSANESGKPGSHASGSGDDTSAESTQGAPGDGPSVTGGPGDLSGGETEIRPVPPGLDRPDRNGPGSTSVLPPVEGAAARPRWSARASVRTPDIADDEHPEWIEPQRGMLVPMLVAVCVLLLVALLGLGTWLIFASRPSGTPATTPTVQNASPPATTGARTVTTTTTTTPARTQIPVPDVGGLQYETAAAQLTAAGFVPVRHDQMDREVPKGQVVRTEPPAGTSIFTGTPIDVIVSLGPPEPTPSATAEPTGSSPGPS